MIDLLVDCALFRYIKAGKGNLYQLGGIPISELDPLTKSADKEVSLPASSSTRNAELRPSDISFVRSRMLYARAALNARGLVHFGLRHIRMFTPISSSSVALIHRRCPAPIPIQELARRQYQPTR
jgi:telomerase reverse transcriptase